MTVDSDLDIILQYKICNAVSVFFEEIHKLVQGKKVKAK